MKNILIVSTAKDDHYNSISSWLNTRNTNTILWNPSHLGQDSFSSAQISSDKETVGNFKLQDVQLDFGNLHALWIRKLFFPKFLNIEDVSDRNNAAKVGIQFITGILEILSESIATVNPYKNLMSAERKVYQYWAAKKVGMNILDSLISNDFERIKKFIPKGNATKIFKPLSQVSWIDNDGNEQILPTTKIGIDDIEFQSTRYFPGIFQQFIDKDFEVRVLFLGKKYLAAKIDSTSPQNHFDWRTWPVSALTIEPITLPNETIDASFRLLKALNLKMGVFDFVVDKSGNYFFMEVNPSGNFLAMERICPELKLTEFMGQFLLSLAESDR